MAQTASCGCRLADEARRARGAERTDLQADARDWQARWSCPCAGYVAPSSPEQLPDECRAALDEVECATGATGLCTCPRAYLALPWVGRIARARAYRDNGSLASIEPNPPAALFDAMAVIDQAYAERHRVERREAEAARDQHRG